MIKFFRHIRKRFVLENKLSKYLLYAIGEIILVVIGILIALSINNWNENRKLQREEVSLLQEVRSNLEVTLNNFRNDTLLNKQNIIQLRKIEQYIEEDLPYHTELDTAFGLFGQWQSPYPITTAYTTLKTKGLDLISNKPLRNKIVNMYEFELVLLQNDYDKGEWGIVNNANAFLVKHIRSENSKQSARPNDFEDLKDQVEFSNIVGKIIAQREVGIRMYKTTMKAIASLIVQIDTELTARK